MNTTIERVRPAMGSLFTLRLIGDDEQHLAAVADAAFDEIARVERLLSWRDPRSECARVNRNATHGDVLIDYELLGILQTCDAVRFATGGYFDVTGGAYDAMSLDAVRRVVRFQRDDVRLDFGAFGKGYSLDCAAGELRRFGIERALLDGGTSSVLALGGDEQDRPWRVGLRDPFASPPSSGPESNDRKDRNHEFAQLGLRDAALSCSATFGDPHSDETGVVSDIVDPHTGRPLTERAACAVVADSAATAEILSTALLCMGRAGAAAYTKTASNEFLDMTALIVWIAPTDGAPTLDVLLERSTGILL